MTKYVQQAIFLDLHSEDVSFAGCNLPRNRSVKMPSTVLSVISPGICGAVLSTRLALVPRILWIVAIGMASSCS